MGATDTIVNGDNKLGCDAKPKGVGRCGIAVVSEAMGEPFFHVGKGLEGDGALVGFGEFMNGDGVGDSDGVGVGSGFNSGKGEVTKGDGN